MALKKLEYKVSKGLLDHFYGTFMVPFRHCSS